MPKVTIAVPTYNRQEYLKQTISSILAQTFQDFNILVFDNHSDYNIAQILSEFKDSRISLLQNPENLGNQKNFYKIYKHKFSSPYVVIFHDDDFMHPELLEQEIKVLESLPDAIFAASSLKFIHRRQNIANFSKLRRIPPQVCQSPAELARIIFSGQHICFDSVMYKSRFLEDMEINFEYGKWSDRPILLKLAEKGRVVFLNQPLVNYRVHQSQDSRSERLSGESFELLKKLLRLYYYYLPKPLSSGDQNLFYSFSTNNIIRSLPTFAGSLSQAAVYLKACLKEKLVDFKYLNLRGFLFLGTSFYKIVFKRTA